MSDMQKQRRLDILANPTETLDIECKSWLDLLNKQHHKAKLAKVAIAMANSGGGTIALGITQEKDRDKRLVCVPKPPHVARYNSDTVASAISQYAKPELHFELKFENHPETGDEYAFVEIAGGLEQPVFSKKTFEGEIKKNISYIRKPGPRSEEPNELEWRDLLHRCMRAAASLTSSENLTDEQQLQKFMAASKERWQERLQEVDENDVACLRHGYWAFAFSIIGESTWPTLNDLRRTLEETQPAYPRQRLFAHLRGRGSSPYPAGEAIEAWTGHPEEGLYRDPYNCAFWRATVGGDFYHLEGFFEDGEDSYRRAEPGTAHYQDLSIQLHAMMLRLAARIAKSVSDDAEIVICSEFTGLRGRYLTGSQAWWRPRGDAWPSSIDTVVLQPRRLAPQQINDDLVEILYDYLCPLYKQFKFFELKRGWVETAVERTKRDGW